MPITTILHEEGGVPIKIWTNDIDTNSRQQLLNTSKLPCLYHHMAVMPDVHFGIGSTVGSVIATKKAIIPAAVGVDIGCGMIAAKLPFVASQLPDNLKELRSEIEWGVPVGFDQHRAALKEVNEWEGWLGFSRIPSSLHKLREKTACQLGTLGGGNHFIEICLDTQQCVWVMLHSGSRHIGNKIATTHIEIAKGIWGEHLKDLTDPNLAYLAEGTFEFANYWNDLQWAQTYAMRNREIMMKKVLQAIGKVLLKNWQADIRPFMIVNCHHNYAERETHFGEEVIITRKGAVRATENDYGIIPGSMGVRSFIVRGKGNVNAFNSCSHGAGRLMSRAQAKKKFTIEDLIDQTKGVECRKDKGVIDEIPGAYKSIDEVMAHQNDLVTIVAELKQILCVKG